MPSHQHNPFALSLFPRRERPMPSHQHNPFALSLFPRRGETDA